MNNLDYVKRACSEDSTRINLTKIYRDIENFVATDGHRLHLSPKLNVVDKAHFIDGSTNSEFPAYKQVLPSKAPLAQIEIVINHDNLKRLKSLLTFHKQTINHKTYFTEFVFNDKGKLFLNIENSGLEIKFPLAHYVVINSDKFINFKIPLNLKYFYEAILFDKDYSFLSFTISIYSETEGFKIESSLGTALIMPLNPKGNY